MDALLLCHICFLNGIRSERTKARFFGSFLSRGRERNTSPLCVV